MNYNQQKIFLFTKERKTFPETHCVVIAQWALYVITDSRFLRAKHTLEAKHKHFDNTKYNLFSINSESNWFPFWKGHFINKSEFQLF